MSVSGPGGPVTPPPAPKDGKGDVDEDKENQASKTGGFTLGGSNIPKGPRTPKRTLADRFGRGNVTVTDSGGPSVKKTKMNESKPGESGVDQQNEE